ncbi:MAG TPA: glycosyltransferase family 4 protein [Gemmatimonadales bacterium]|nr:glycosyltransferase family 4 protein [Gemmatimonadales bacterium]
MKLLVVNWLDRLNPQAGGAEIHLFEIFRRIAARGHEVRLVCSGWPGAPPSEVVDGIDVTRVSGRHGFALAGRGAVRRALARSAPDVLVEDINKLPLFLAASTDRPICVLVPHLFGTTAFQEAPWPMAAAVWLSERPIPWAYRRADFQAISESTRDDLVARGVPADRIRVIHPGVDPVEFAPDPAVPRTSPPSFLYVGRLKRYKGVDVAIRALAAARQVRPDLSLDIAGTGDDRPRLEAVARELGQAGAVRFHGFVPEARKLALLRSTWGNLFPSPKEGWGITVVEAAACGTPSIASDSPGLRDSVRAGVTGYLVPHGDPAALAAGMLEFAADRGLVDRLGQAGRRFAESLTWDRTADLTEAHLRDLAGR